MIQRTILGLDPGSHATGFALVTVRCGVVVDFTAGAWTADRRWPRARVLGEIVNQAESWFAQRRADEAAVESPFMQRNARAALALAEARGALLSFLGRQSIAVREFSPAMVKKTICGFGGADKDQVRRALARTVPGLDEAALAGLPLDATDAVAIAVCAWVVGRTDALVGRSDR